MYILWYEKFEFAQIKSHILFQGEIQMKWWKIHWRFKKNVSRSNGLILINLGKYHRWVTKFNFRSNDGQYPFPKGDNYKKEAHLRHRSPVKQVQMSVAYIDYMYRRIYHKIGPVVLKEKRFKLKLSSSSGEDFKILSMYFSNFVKLSLWKKVWLFNMSLYDQT